MLLETTMPVIMITPINDMMLSVLPVNSRIITTPASPGGIAIRMMNGSMNEVNCAIRIEIDKSNRDEQAQGRNREGLVHAHRRAAHVKQGVLISLGIGDQLVDVLADRLQRLASWWRHKYRSRGESGSGPLLSVY